MREAFGGLTTRGRCFLAAGVTAVVCALLLGQAPLVRVGVLLVCVPVVTALFAARGRHRLALSREVAPAVVAAGQTTRVSLTLTNEGRRSRGVVLLEDRVPYLLGARPRFVLDGPGRRHAQHRMDYEVRSEVRGRFHLGPLQLQIEDPFGMVRMRRTFTSTSTIVVTPRAVPLPEIPLGGAHSGAGDDRPRAFATGSAEDVTVREYRTGDDLRRVHWPSSARAGDLMVRREEQPWQARATLLLDNRASAHRGSGVASSLEAAVTMTASVALHLTQRGFDVRLVTAAGEEPGAAWHAHRPETETRQLLETLAVIEPLKAGRLESGWLADQGHGGLAIAVLGQVGEADLPMLRQVQHRAGQALAVTLDVGAWASSRRDDGESTSAAPLLAAQGWRASTLRPGERPSAAWERLGLAAGHLRRGPTTEAAG